MKILILVMLFTLPAYSDTKCHLYEVSGSVRFSKTGMEMVIAEKTGSQRKLPFKLELQNKLAPYVDHFVKGEFVFGEDKIVAIKSIEDALPNPLAAGEQNTLKKIKEEQCPKL